MGIRAGNPSIDRARGRFQRGRGSVDEYLELTAIANPARGVLLQAAGGGGESLRARRRRAAAAAEGDQAAPLRHRARNVAEDAPGHDEPLARRILDDRFLARERARGRRHLQDGEAIPTNEAAHRGGTRRGAAVSRAPERQDHGAADRLFVSDRRGGDPRGPLQTDPRRVLHGGDAPPRFIVGIRS